MYKISCTYFDGLVEKNIVLGIKYPEMVHGVTFAIINNNLKSNAKTAYIVNLINNDKVPVYFDSSDMTDSIDGYFCVPYHQPEFLEIALKNNFAVKQVVAERIVAKDRMPEKDAEIEQRELVACVVSHPAEPSKFLLVKPNGSDFWSPLTGGIDPGETALEAGLRELYEEVGFTDVNETSVCTEEITSEYFAQHKGVNRLAFIKTIKVKLNSLKQAEDSELIKGEIEAKWVTFSEALSEQIGSGAKEIFQIALGLERPPITTGRMINSGSLNGELSDEAKLKVLKKLSTSKN